jgi:replicative DNA helicase
MSDWEKSLIATVLADPPTMEACQDLRPSDFTGANQAIWAEMMVLAGRSQLEARALLNSLRASPDWPRLGEGQPPEDYLAELMQFRGTQIQVYVEHVLEASTRRALQANAALIAAEAGDNRRTAAELLDYAEQRILSLRRDRSTGGKTMAELVGVFIPRLEGLRSGAIQPAWTPNVLAVREIIQYAEPSEFIIIASRPGEGKSSYMRFEADETALRGQHVTIFNAENDEIEYPRYLISKRTRIDSLKLKDPRLLSPVELERVRAAAGELARAPIRIHNAAGMSAVQIVRLARRGIVEDHTKLIIMDYIQLVSNGIENRVLDIGESSRQFRVAALQYGVPWMIAAQLSRNIEVRSRAGDADPQLSDLRDSGALEQDATIVTFPRSWSHPTAAQLAVFPENHDRNGRLLPMPKAVPVWFHVLKNRNGGTGVSEPVKWYKALDIYETLQQGAVMR